MHIYIDLEPSHYGDTSVTQIKMKQEDAERINHILQPKNASFWKQFHGIYFFREPVPLPYPYVTGNIALVVTPHSDNQENVTASTPLTLLLTGLEINKENMLKVFPTPTTYNANALLQVVQQLPLITQLNTIGTPKVTCNNQQAASAWAGFFGSTSPKQESSPFAEKNANTCK